MPRVLSCTRWNSATRSSEAGSVRRSQGSAGWPMSARSCPETISRLRAACSGRAPTSSASVSPGATNQSSCSSAHGFHHVAPPRIPTPASGALRTEVLEQPDRGPPALAADSSAVPAVAVTAAWRPAGSGRSRGSRRRPRRASRRGSTSVLGTASSCHQSPCLGSAGGASLAARSSILMTGSSCSKPRAC